MQQLKFKSKTDGLEEDTVAKPVIYDSEKDISPGECGDHTPLWEPFSGIGPYIFLVIFLHT